MIEMIGTEIEGEENEAGSEIMIVSDIDQKNVPEDGTVIVVVAENRIVKTSIENIKLTVNDDDHVPFRKQS